MELKCVPNAGVIDPVEELFHLETHISPRVSGSLSTLSAYKHVHNVVNLSHRCWGNESKVHIHKDSPCGDHECATAQTKKRHTHILFKHDERSNHAPLLACMHNRHL